MGNNLMTDEKQTNTQKSQEPSVENGQGLEPPEPNERGVTDQAMSDSGSEPHVGNGVTDDLASEDVNPEASAFPSGRTAGSVVSDDS